MARAKRRGSGEGDSCADNRPANRAALGGLVPALTAASDQTKNTDGKQKGGRGFRYVSRTGDDLPSQEWGDEPERIMAAIELFDDDIARIHTGRHSAEPFRLEESRDCGETASGTRTDRPRQDFAYHTWGLWFNPVDGARERWGLAEINPMAGEIQLGPFTESETSSTQWGGVAMNCR